MGVQDRDWYRDHHRQGRPAGRAANILHKLSAQASAIRPRSPVAKVAATLIAAILASLLYAVIRRS